jgi:hypothetical protein
MEGSGGGMNDCFSGRVLDELRREGKYLKENAFIGAGQGS